MIDMTPAEMRTEAIRLRYVADANAEHGWENNADSCRAGADALDRLAAVIEYSDRESDAANVRHWTEREEARFDAMEDILRIARGETNEREEP